MKKLWIFLLVGMLPWLGLAQEARPRRKANQDRDARQRQVEAAAVQAAMSPQEIAAGLESHDRALYIKEGWIRDPYITLGPDDFYYLTGTTPAPDDSREKSDPYNTGLGPLSIVVNVASLR